MNENFKDIGGVLRLIATEFGLRRQGARWDGGDIATFCAALRGLARLVDDVVADYERLRRFERDVERQQQMAVGQGILAVGNVVMLPRRAVLSHVNGGRDEGQGESR